MVPEDKRRETIVPKLNDSSVGREPSSEQNVEAASRRFKKRDETSRLLYHPSGEIRTHHKTLIERGMVALREVSADSVQEESLNLGLIYKDSRH